MGGLDPKASANSYQAVGPGTGKRTYEEGKSEGHGQPEDGNRQRGGRPRSARSVEERRFYPEDGGDHQRGDEPLPNANGQVDAHHSGQDEPRSGDTRKRELARARGGRHHRCDPRGERRGGDAQCVMRARVPPAESDHEANQGEPDDRMNDAHVEDVRAEGKQATVSKRETLHRQNRGHHDYGRRWTEQHSRENAPDEVARCATRHGEVDHLRGENEGRGHAHGRDGARA